MSWPPPRELVTIWTLYAAVIGFTLALEALQRAKARRIAMLERLEHLERLELIRRRYREALDDPPSSR